MLTEILSVPFLIATAWATAAQPANTSGQRVTAITAVPSQPRRQRRVPVDPFSFVSRTRLLDALTELTGVGSDSLYRTSASSGERLAFELVRNHLEELDHLRALGLELEEEPFHTYIGQEAWEARLFLSVGGSEVEVQAHAILPHRDDLVRAMRLDSDGILNDTARDPLEVAGAPLLITSPSQLASPAVGLAAGRLVLLDFALVDRSVLASETAIDRAETLLSAGPTAVVLITSFSNTLGESHGSFVGDLGAFTLAGDGPPAPTIYTRIEDLGPAGIDDWQDLSTITRARLRWDCDVVSPGSSRNLVATIPGRDRSRAVILGAHLDSPNSPGALDNGSGSVTLLEVARALDDARAQPDTDVVLAWFGSHERGLFGSTVFHSTHQELEDRAAAMLQVDCLSRMVDGIQGELYLESWTYGRFGDARPTLAQYLEAEVAARHIDAMPISYYGLVSDNTSSNSFDLPNANLIYSNFFVSAEVHYAGHLHDPYDTVTLATQEAATLEAMATTALAAALRIGIRQPVLRVTPPPTRRAVLVASHTEAPHMAGPSFIDFGMALAWDGYDVDVVPYGQSVTAADLAGASMVVALPVHDYPSPDGDVTVYDEAWGEDEIDALENYVTDGGLLVLTNAARRIKYLNYLYELNEDSGDGNSLGNRLGVTWNAGTVAGATATTSGTHTLVQGVASLALAEGNGVRYSAPGGVTLARAGVTPVATLLDHGVGEVLVLADLGILGSPPEAAPNLTFFRNLARYARSR